MEQLIDHIKQETKVLDIGVETPLLEKKILDELDKLLLGLNSDSDLIKMRYGDYDAILDKRTDWQRMWL